MRLSYHLLTTDSKIRKHIKKNTVGFGLGRKKALCPMCILRLEEVVMPFNDEIKQYQCKICGYIPPRNIGPVNSSIVEAGNEELAQKPYIGTVQYHKKPQFAKMATDFYDTPGEAWNNDDA